MSICKMRRITISLRLTTLQWNDKRENLSTTWQITPCCANFQCLLSNTPVWRNIFSDIFTSGKGCMTCQSSATRFISSWLRSPRLLETIIPRSKVKPCFSFCLKIRIHQLQKKKKVQGLLTEIYDQVTPANSFGRSLKSKLFPFWVFIYFFLCVSGRGLWVKVRFNGKVAYLHLLWCASLLTGLSSSVGLCLRMCCNRRNGNGIF